MSPLPPHTSPKDPANQPNQKKVRGTFLTELTAIARRAKSVVWEQTPNNTLQPEPHQHRNILSDFSTGSQNKTSKAKQQETLVNIVEANTKTKDASKTKGNCANSTKVKTNVQQTCIARESEKKVERTQVTHNATPSTEESQVLTQENKPEDKSSFQQLNSNVGLKIYDSIVYREKKACVQQPREIDFCVPDNEEANLAGTGEDRAQGIAYTETNVQSNTIIASKKVPHSQDKPHQAASNRDSIISTSSQSSRVRKTSKTVIRLDDRSNVGKLADQIIPQLNNMQKNLLGLLFFNELSPNIVEDMIAQQLSMLPTSQLAETLQNLGQETVDVAVPVLVSKTSGSQLAGLACQALATLEGSQGAAVLLATADNDVMEVLLQIAEYGGKSFKKALIKNIIEDEDDIMDAVVYEHLLNSNNKNIEPPHQSTDSSSECSLTEHFSAEDEEFTSCDELLDEEQ